jgi:hypothetical protein
MKKYVYLMCSVVILGLTACTSEGVVVEEIVIEGADQPTATESPLALTTLHPISCDSAKIHVKKYGEFVGKTLGDYVSDVPRYWDISVEELQRVLSHCNGSDSGETVRVYLARRDFKVGTKTEEMIDLILVPLVADSDGYKEDLQNAHDLISPCPSTCGGITSNLEHSYYSGAIATADSSYHVTMPRGVEPYTCPK